MPIAVAYGADSETPTEARPTAAQSEGQKYRGSVASYLVAKVVVGSEAGTRRGPVASLPSQFGHQSAWLGHGRLADEPLADVGRGLPIDEAAPF